MAQRYDITTITFQANARGANAAIESLRQEAERCNQVVTNLKKDLKDGIKMGKSTGELDNIRASLKAAGKEAKQWSKAYNELIKGMRVLDQGIKTFNDGTLNQMSAAFQKTLYNAAKLTRLKLNPDTDSYKEDFKQLTALMDAAKQNFAKLQSDASSMLETLRKGGKVSVATLREELNAQKELLSVLAETDKGYKMTQRNVAELDLYLRKAASNYTFIRQNMTDTKKVSDEMLTAMYNELRQVNKEGNVTQKIMRENANAMREIRAEQARRVESTLGGNLGQRSEQQIRSAITMAKELLATYKTSSREAQTLSAQIINAEEHLKTHGVEAARTAAREAEQIRTQEEAEKQLQATMNKRLTSLKTLSADALAETRKYWEAQRNGAEQGSAAFTKAENALKKISNQERERKVAGLQNILGDPKKFGIDQVRAAVQEMEKLRGSVREGSNVWLKYNKLVEQGKQYLDNLSKSQSADRINQQMSRLNSLSASGLAEVRKYWEAQLAGAERSSQAFKDAETALKRIQGVENTRTAGQSMRVLSRPGNYGDAEIRKAIQATEQLRDAQSHGSQRWKMYNNYVQQGKKYLEEWSQIDGVLRMEGQLTNLTRLSDAALQESKRFWETMVAGAAKGSAELRQYETYLEKVMQEERERNQLSNEMKAQRLGGNLSNMSEGEIREAIEAGKQLIQTYRSASPEADNLSKRIVAAEQHLKQYGLEAERAAQRERDAVKKAADERAKNDALMKWQLQQGGIQLSDSALKAQASYWQRLIDDPKTAAESLQEYKRNLADVQRLMARKVDVKGESALERFRRNPNYAESVSENALKEKVEDLKRYRDSLPKSDNAAIIKEIDDILQKVGASAKKAAAETMSFKQAMQVSAQAGKGQFRGTVEQLTQAKKALEDLSAKAVKGGLAWRRMQEALQRIELELKNVGHLSEEVQAVLDKPKGKSLNALKQAIEQGRAALANMDRTTKEGQKRFDELAKKVREADFELKKLTGTAKGSATAFEKAWSRLKTYISLYMGAAVAIQKIVGTFGDLMELSDKMGEVRKTTGFAAEEVGRLSENLAKMDTRTSLTGLMDLSVAAGQLGLKTQEDVLGFTEAANKLMVALPEMGKEGATEMLKVALATGEIDKIRKQMEQGLIDGSSATAVAMEKVGSTIDRLRATSAATAPAITDFVKRVGAVGAQSGISIDQVAALGSTVDALGMRVEMSATALSRMLPAIRNNSFDIAKILGVTPNTIRELYDAGRGMEVILMIFQHIKDAGMDADSIEGMLGMGGMKEIMKELNQQGARAGIVFGGLSQNVDELRRQLGVAAQAYEENIAIQQEYDKMNETTAAKWERLKNQVEEYFVSDRSQRWLGGIIDGLRKIVDILTGSNGISVAIRLIISYMALVRLGLADGIVKALTACLNGARNLGVAFGIIGGEMKKMQYANIFTALAGALLLCYNQIKNLIDATSLAGKALGEVNVQIDVAQARFERYYAAVQSTSKALVLAQREHNTLSAEVDRLRNSTDGSAKSTEVLKTKEDALKESEDKLTKAKNEHRNAIANMNSIYAKYLGFMLTEYDRAELLAAAHDKVAAAIRREMLAKEQQAAIDKVNDKYREGLSEGKAKISDQLSNAGLNAQQTAQAKNDLDKFFNKNVKYNANSNKYTVSKNIFQELGRKGYNVKGATAEDITAIWYREYLKDNFHLDDWTLDKLSGITTTENSGGKRVRIENGGWKRVVTTKGTARGNYIRTRLNQVREQTQMADVYGGELTDAIIEDKQTTIRLIEELRTKANSAKSKITNAKTDAERNKAYEDLALSLEGIDRRMGDLDPIADKKLISDLKAQADNLSKGVDGRKLSEARARANSIFARATGGAVDSNYDRHIPTHSDRGSGGGNVWGNEVPADSTDYSDMSVEELVARRNQMDKFKNYLKPGVIVKEVLAEDKALIKAFEGKDLDYQQAIEWYNTERKKITDVLKSEKHSTNQGHWLDETDKKTGRKRRVNPLLESDYALAELDRYYSRRKEKLEKARIEENLSEEAFNRQAELLEQEHLEKRSKLRATFTGEVSKEETAAFRKWWDDLEKMNELDEVSWATVESEWAKATAAQIGRNNYRMQKDLTDMRMITVKHLNAIAKIIAKERPYDAITDNLRKNLTDMGILFADMEKDGGIMDTRKLVQAQARRMTALMELAEDAYSLTSKELMDRLRIQEYTHEWALAIEDDDTLVNALMAQLHKAYDEIQNAIQKEANIIKKQSEIIWKNAVPELGNRSRKDTFEGILSAMGLEEDRVKRANELIGAGQASERVADRLAIKQMQIRLTMEEHYYNLMQAKGEQRIAMLLREKDAEEEKAKTLQEQAKTLREQGREEEAITAERKAQEATQKSLQAKFDAQHAAISLNLSMSEEQKKIDEQRVEIANQLEESQNRLYKYMREWGELVVSSAQSVFEASHAGDAEYYNERAKMNLTGKGGPGAGTYIVIDNEGTSSARAHYEYLSEAEALERQHEIERENAKAEAWKKVMDDLNMKMSDMITDQINAMLQNAAVNANTKAVEENTAALEALNRQSMKVVEDNADVMNDAQIKKRASGSISFGDIEGETEDHAEGMEPMKIKTIPGTETPDDTYNGISNLPRAQQKRLGLPVDQNPYDYTQGDVVTDPMSAVQAEINADNMLTETVVSNAMKRKEAKIEASNKSSEVAVSNSNKEAKVTTENDKKEKQSTQSKFAAMAQALNMYGVAYQAMSNDNMDTAQKFMTFALQAAGQTAIAMLTTDMFKAEGDQAVKLPGIFGKAVESLGPVAGPIAFAAMTALLGGLMGMAMSKVTKSKSQISQVTGASVGAGRLATGMLTYAEGNVNELTDPASLTPGRSYNVDGRDGKTYRAKYMGVGARTHITSGPEFHLVGEAGREAIIDAKTTRNIRMNEPDIWRSIQTLYNGGSLRHTPARRRRGVRAFADGNIEDFDEISQMGDMDSMGIEGIQAALDRNSAVQEALLERLQQPIYAQNILYGADGLPNVIAKLQKEAERHGVKYL